MPLSSLGCSSCAVVLTAALTLLLVPAPYLVPSLFEEGLVASSAPLPEQASPPQRHFSVERLKAQCPPLDLFASIVMLVIGFFTYLCEWIQRKLMERRIIKLNQYLFASVERLRAWDRQQEQLESTLRLVRGAAGEYGLLLLLLLRRRRPPPAACRDKGPAFLPPTLDV